MVHCLGSPFKSGDPIGLCQDIVRLFMTRVVDGVWSCFVEFLVTGTINGYFMFIVLFVPYNTSGLLTIHLTTRPLGVKS